MSGTGNYRVDAGREACTCDCFELTGKPCKHILAVDIVRSRDTGLPVPELPKEEDNRTRRADALVAPCSRRTRPSAVGSS